MVQFFDQNYTSPDAQALRRGARVDAGTTGPNAPANTDPHSYKNPFVSALNKQPPTKNFYNQVYSSQEAEAAQNRIDNLGSMPLFQQPGDQQLAVDFLNKYALGAQRGLVNQPISQQTVAMLQTQTPNQGMAEGKAVNAAHRMNYPGKSGTQTT